MEEKKRNSIFFYFLVFALWGTAFFLCKAAIDTSVLKAVGTVRPWEADAIAITLPTMAAIAVIIMWKIFKNLRY
jgi:hypothetical protein